MNTLTRITLGRLIPAGVGGIVAGLIDVEIQEALDVEIEQIELVGEVSNPLEACIDNPTLDVDVDNGIEVDVNMITVDVGICNG